MLDFLVSNLPIFICAIAGMALVVLEVYIPGFGLPGISGAALILIAVIVTWVKYEALAALGVTVIIGAVLALIIVTALRSTDRGKLFKKLSLEETVGTEEGEEEASGLRALVGRTGITSTILRPVGAAEIDGTRMDVTAESGFIEQGRNVIVARVEGTRVIVNER